ncbi:PAS domain-containing sensor histidine kinase [Mucilaginibacter mali]|uniref:histidine kinase n=1 Tax=Mucilaginibacter mali TaxID=2740462 RepID=A0A7D4QXG4_9SPHI|nr:PAS domain-containing sensor histidine kinase [Mucilaginibacter mali]QKJ32749.1 PAS domain-containing sensor histidine kinase [Mucilaginibacter mali]
MEYTQQELMNFFNATDDVFFSADRITFRLTKISNACKALFGYEPDELLGDLELWFNLAHPEDRHLAVHSHEQLLRGEQIKSRYRIIRKDGAIRWVEKKVIPVLNDNGEVIQVDGMVRDITESKIAEEKLRENEARYRRIVETSQEGIWTIDEHNKTNFVNKKICELLGYTPEEMLGRSLFDFFDDEERISAATRMDNRRMGVKENIDIRYKTKSGENLWTNISANPIFDDTGRYKGSLAMITDISKRKKDEEALKISEANLRTLFNNTDSSYVLFNSDLKIVSFNNLAQQYSIAQNNKKLEVNRSVKDYFTEKRWPFIQEILDKVKNEGSAEYELSFISNGAAKWHHVRWLTVKNDDQENWGFILANKDITEAKTAALERERITTDLIQHNKDLEQFTYIISHNLRSPVANILGLAELLNARTTSAAEKDMVFEMVASAVRNLDTIIRDLNHILQVREPMNEKKEMVLFKDVVESIETTILNSAIKENVLIDCDFAEIESMYTIRSYLYSIFYNLLSNSIKFRKPGIPARISIKSHRYLLNDRLELRFKDNGKGIDLAKNTANLFGLYKRFDTSTEGKGMGLFMVKTQVEALGGTIHIESQPDEGTEFIVQFGLQAPIH